MKPIRLTLLFAIAYAGSAPWIGRSAALPVRPGADAPLYSVTLLEPGKAVGRDAQCDFRGMNNRGDLIGWVTSKTDQQTYVWRKGEPIKIMPPEGLSCIASALNDKGQVAGQMNPPKVFNQSDAFLWEKGRVTKLPGLGGGTASAHAINNLGQIVGVAQGPGGEQHAVLWQNGQIRDLGTLGGKGAWASDINERGQIVGASRTVAGDMHAFLWQNGKMTDLGTLPGYPDSSATAINDAGQIAGDLSWGRGVDAPSGRHTFLWEKGKMTDLGTAGGTHGHPLGMNKGGLIVGMSFTANKKQCGYLFRAGKIVALNTLLTPKDAAVWDVYFATTVNDKGWILAAAHRKGKDGREMVLLKPVAAK